MNFVFCNKLSSNILFFLKYSYYICDAHSRGVPVILRAEIIPLELEAVSTAVRNLK